MTTIKLAISKNLLYPIIQEKIQEIKEKMINPLILKIKIQLQK